MECLLGHGDGGGDSTSGQELIRLICFALTIGETEFVLLTGQTANREALLF